MIETAKNILINSRGYKSSQKLIVIESDDWGSVRMPSQQSYENLLRAGIAVDKCGYNSLDNLETEDDLNAILETFSAIPSPSGRPPVLTANTIVANPDYDSIRESKFEKYEYETFENSHLRYNGNKKVLNLIIEGINDSLYFPQLHGREHIYIKHWMNSLRANDRETTIAFNNQVYGLSTTIAGKKRKSFLTALDFDEESEIADHEQILTEASDIFEKSFGFRSESFIAPNYTWHPKHELIFQKMGVKIIQGGRAQKCPAKTEYVTLKHYMGKRNGKGLLYSIRNSAFEPSIKMNINWRKKILKEAKIAFFLRSPLIISTHRVNFMGGIVEKNRTENLKLFSSILNEIIRLYPDVEFINSAELGFRMNKKD